MSRLAVRFTSKIVKKDKITTNKYSAAFKVLFKSDLIVRRAWELRDFSSTAERTD